MATLPPWLQPQDVVGAYLGGAARGDASRRTALAERAQAADEQQAQQRLNLEGERINAANRAQELDLAGIALRSQAQQAAAQEKMDFARAVREQKAAEAAVRFQGASEFSRLVSNGVSTDRALLQAGSQMFYNKPDALIGALQKEEQQSALKLFRDAEQSRKLEAEIGRLEMSRERSQNAAERLLLETRLRDATDERNRLTAMEGQRKTKADEARERNAYVKQLYNDGVDAIEATENWQRMQAGEETLSTQEMLDRSRSRAAISQLETLKRAGEKKATVSVNQGFTTVGKPWLFNSGEPIDTLIARYHENIGGSTTNAKPKRVRVRDKKSNKTGWWEGDEVPDIYEIIEE